MIKAVLDYIDYLQHGPVAKMWLKHHFGKMPQDLRVVLAVEHVRTVIKAAKAGLGVAVVPEHLIATDLEAGRLKLLTPTNLPWINQIYLARRLERSVSAREKKFMEFYRNYLKDMS